MILCCPPDWTKPKCFYSVNNQLEMNTWVSYEVLQAFFSSVGSFSGCFATYLLTSHVTRHMWLCLFGKQTHTFPLCDTEMITYSLTQQTQTMHTKIKKFHRKDNHHFHLNLLCIKSIVMTTATSFPPVLLWLQTLSRTVCAVAVMWLLKWLGVLVTLRDWPQGCDKHTDPYQTHTYWIMQTNTTNIPR